MQIQSRKGERVSYNTHDISSTQKEYLEHLLFCHAFIGCDTTSQIYNFGKKSIFNKLKIFKDLQDLSKWFYLNSATAIEIGNAKIRVLNYFILILQQMRKQKYDTMVTSDRSNIDP